MPAITGCAASLTVPRGASYCGKILRFGGAEGDWEKELTCANIFYICYSDAFLYRPKNSSRWVTSY